MAIPNVNQITSMLRMLDDRPQNPELQRYAQLHKNDPFLFPLIVAEDTARKQMRAAQQARMMGGEPPKVNEQAVAAIGQQPLPSQGALPQGNPMPPQGAGPAPAGLPTLRTGIQNMADGGIAGYPDEDEVGMAEGGVARYNGQTGSVTYVNPYVQGVLALDPDFDEQGQPRTRRESEMIRAKQKEAAVQKQRAETYSVGLNLPPSEYIQRMEDFYRPRYPAAVLEKPQQTVAPNVQVAGQPAPAPGPGPGAAPVRRPPTAAAPAAPAAPAAAAPAAPPMPAMAAPTVAGAKETAAQFLDRQAIERQATDYAKSEETALAKERADITKALKRDGKAYAGLESLLKKEEEGAKGSLEQSKAFAIINAGLAMMAGTSPNALKNIAEGAMVGTKQYQGAISDFNKAAKERQRAMADIEQARRAEDRDDTKTMMSFEQRAADRMANARKFGIQAIMEAGIKSADIAGRIYDTQVTQAGQDRRTQMELESREREGEAGRRTQVQIANIQAGTRDSPLALYRELGDGDIKRGFEIAQEGKVGGSLIKAIVEGVLKNPLMMREYPPAVQQLVNQELTKLGVISGVTSNPPANAQILR